jgi:hypothetical protein
VGKKSAGHVKEKWNTTAEVWYCELQLELTFERIIMENYCKERLL